MTRHCIESENDRKKERKKERNKQTNQTTKKEGISVRGFVNTDKIIAMFLQTFLISIYT
jgi:hypothetical protein